MKNFVLSSLVSLIFTSAAASVTAEGIFPGGAFNSQSQSVMAIGCLTGTEVFEEYVDSYQPLERLKDAPAIEMLSDLSPKFDDAADFRSILLSSEMTANFRSVSSSDYSTVIRFQKKFKTGYWIFKPESVTALAQSALSTSPQAFSRICGDHFISKIDAGVQFDLSVTFGFSNPSYKKVFDTTDSATITDMQTLKSSVNTVLEKYGDGTTIGITLSQQGGSSLAIGNLLTTGSVYCDSSDCVSIFDNIAAYTAANGAIYQSSGENAAYTAAYPVRYSDSVSTDIPLLSTPEDVLSARQELIDELIHQHQLLHEIEVRGTSQSVDAENKTDLYKELITRITENLSYLERSLLTCYDNTSECVLQKVNTLNNLEYIDIPETSVSVYNNFTLDIGRGGYETFCNAPSSSVIVGFGARVHKDDVKGIRIGYRNVLADGSLDEIQYLQCGSGYERYVEVPDGYVLTGLSSRVRKNNIAAVHAAARQWDPETRQLVGDTVHYSDGKGSEMTLTLENFLPADNQLFQPDHSILSGIGLRSTKDNISGVSARVGWLN
ncbi:hypothetical protein ACQUQU_16550 [Thalassolituus sp. LLYu03]|uniref:hypothetical protein n=1 Tax=Thalassolituus sp. LLYu03 TaxID=3421656 RepID=UPI003D2839BB